MKEIKNLTTHSGSPLTLLGEITVVGQLAPDFMGIDIKGNSVKLSDFKGRKIILSVFPSIDTVVCAIQTRTFNIRATLLGEEVVVLAISKDLPFALGRFCGAEGIDRVITLSDYRESEFGLKYGFLIKENKLLARGVIVINPEGKVAYVQYVGDITKEPDYEAALSAVQSL